MHLKGWFVNVVVHLSFVIYMYMYVYNCSLLVIEVQTNVIPTPIFSFL